MIRKMLCRMLLFVGLVLGHFVVSFECVVIALIPIDPGPVKPVIAFLFAPMLLSDMTGARVFPYDEEGIFSVGLLAMWVNSLLWVGVAWGLWLLCRWAVAKFASKPPAVEAAGG